MCGGIHGFKAVGLIKEYLLLPRSRETQKNCKLPDLYEKFVLQKCKEGKSNLFQTFAQKIHGFEAVDLIYKEYLLL